ncbi:nucleotide exchange factor GrpE [Peterkaempfera bronchialis]|uniref:Protein GrpE n=1 Tax=Peterkaempfera bronchialis TaxID=2126346 RepID=A0A345SRH2_9ACTN|nr:nucleotide exchange factor GrpE [Peterkaempfera bronchialis]AXI76327.1 nucleotide exchange factor GrpE [Peterkaempfera bronchialis]
MSRGGRPPLAVRDEGRGSPPVLQPGPTGRRELPGPPGPEPRTAASDDTRPEPEPGPDRSGAGRLREELAERTADLQRVKAEYDNYRKRVQRDRLAVREIAVVNVLGGLLPVLDAIGRAREHGELTGGSGSVAEALEAHLASLGLRSFGEAGEPFDPACHEALLHAYSAEVDRATCAQVLRPGYRVGEHLLRPAQVSVTEPSGPPGTG